MYKIGLRWGWERRLIGWRQCGQSFERYLERWWGFGGGINERWVRIFEGDASRQGRTESRNFGYENLVKIFMLIITQYMTLK